jgi:hypothetical protein
MENKRKRKERKKAKDEDTRRTIPRCRIWGSRRRAYEDFHLLGKSTDYTALYPRGQILPFPVQFRWAFLLKLNSVALVRKRTIPTEQPPLVGEVSANFLRIKGVAWSAQRIPTAVNVDFLYSEQLLFHSSSSPVTLTRLSGPCYRPTTSQKIS